MINRFDRFMIPWYYRGVPGELSGKFLIRLSPRLHASLKKRAREEGVSLNALCLSALRKSLDNKAIEFKEEESLPLRHAREILGESLWGILLFGSVARGEERTSSDVDLMIVVDPQLPLTRTLYRRWDLVADQDPASRFSPHFVHLPDETGKAGSLWLEAAVDGVVLLDRDGRISRFLGNIRRVMAEGRLQRKSAYGHPYWIRRGPEAAGVQ
jgi:predicted nucleotidyltransferase